MRSLRRSIPTLALPSVVALCVACGAARSDDGDEEVAATGQASSSCAVTPIPSQSLFVTDATALANFSLQSVLAAIVKTGSTTGQTALGFYQQMFDTLNDKAHAVTSGPHCDDTLTNGAPSINGFPIECPRQEGTLASTDPFTSVGTNPDSYQPIGLVNRFDLAPANGDNCGQYRVVFGKVSGATNPFDRTLLIFEAVLPNPKPSDGLAACLPVAQFWDDLSSNSSAASRATALQSFYFKGLTGFAPVIQAQNYGIGGGTNTGQIRGNLFMNSVSGQEWELREFRLSQKCSGTPSTCELVANNTLVQNNPFGGLFAGSTSADATFQKEFIGQVQSLAATNLNLISMTTPTADNAGESDEQDTSNDYTAQGGANQSLTTAIGAELTKIGNPEHLTADNILDRATTQSCAGCHQVATGRNLGGGLTWPSSNGFTQIDENKTLSPALTTVFLPFRATVLESFINAQEHCATPDGGTHDSSAPDTGSARDSSASDTGPVHDAGESDGGSGHGDAGESDGGSGHSDAGESDGGSGHSDAGASDGGSGHSDASASDGGSVQTDASEPPPLTVSGQSVGSAN